MLQLRVAPLRAAARCARDWVPRLRVGDRARSSDITAVWEGAVAMRRSVFEAVGGWPEDFRFVHEGIDLAWRVMDAGRRVAYAGEIVALHPSPTGTPHGYSLLLRRPQQGRGSRAGTCRSHWRSSTLANFVLRTLPRLRSAGRRARRRCAATATACAGRAASAPLQGADAVADDPRRPTPDHVSLLA